MKYNLLIISFLTFTWSCTTKINLDTVYEKRIVIQGNISESNVAQVQLTQTVSATDEDVFPVVTNAVVQLTDSEGNRELLTEETDGIYVGNMLQGEAGKLYELEVEFEEEISFATTKLLEFSATLEQLTLTTLPPNPNSPIPQLLSIDFQKTEEDSIYLIFSIAIDSFENDSTIFYKNEQNAPKQLTIPLQTFNFLLSGSILKVEVTQVEKWFYDYLNAIPGSGNQEIISGLLIGPPDNLQGNIEGEALGFFGAITQRFIEITVP